MQARKQSGQRVAEYKSTPTFLDCDADDLQRKPKNFRLPCSCRCIKLDVKDYYLTGKHGHLIERSASILDPEIRDDFSLLAKAILSNQYVVSHVFPGVTHRVICGTGMGMIPSGAISDAALYAKEHHGLLEFGVVLHRPFDMPKIGTDDCHIDLITFFGIICVREQE